MTLSSSRLHLENPDAIANHLMQRTHNRDGLSEIATGLFFICVAGLMGLHEASHGESLFGLASLCLLILSPAVLFVSKWAIKQARARFLIEKVGYVKLKPLNGKLMARVVGIAFVTAGVAAFATYSFVRTPGTHPQSNPWELLTNWSVAVGGVFGGILWAKCGRLPRFVICGAVMAATGIALAFTGVSPELGFTILYGSAGLLLLVSGCVVLLHFVRKPAESGE